MKNLQWIDKTVIILVLLLIPTGALMIGLGNLLYGGMIAGFAIGMPFTMMLVRHFEAKDERENQKLIDSLPE